MPVAVRTTLQNAPNDVSFGPKKVIMDELSGHRIPAHPTKSIKYSSPSIIERRRRILKEARQLIAEQGIQGFSIRELCRRAEVAQRTLYNAFHSKDRLIALAIREAYDYVDSHVHYRTSADTLDGILDRMIAVNTRNRGARNYTRAVTSLYFAADVSEDIWHVLRHMVFNNLMRWLHKVEASGGLRPGIGVNELAHNFANLEYSVINDWSQGRIKDEDYLPRLLRSFLCLAVGSMQGDARESAHAYLEGTLRSGQIPRFPLPSWRPSEGAEMSA